VAISVSEHPNLQGFSGLLLMGGTDVNPQRYGQERRAEVDTPDDERDEVELGLVREALERDLPILAICRGLQLLNVYHGGTLIQHLDDAVHDPETEDKAVIAHGVVLESESHLASIYGEQKLRVNSRHHQAVDRPGEGLRVSARDAETSSVIEGLEQVNRKFVVGVQWHPEDQIDVLPEQLRLFERFGKACG
jgi:putative glutamine amidotransferase